MSRRKGDMTSSECVDGCAMSGFIGALAGGFIVTLIAVGMLVLGGGPCA